MSDVAPEVQKTVLHVGCGSWRPNALHKNFQTPEWRGVK
jgi:hypothetical protein